MHVLQWEEWKEEIEMQNGKDTKGSVGQAFPITQFYQWASRRS